jgi:hypothetical protein
VNDQVEAMTQQACPGSDIVEVLYGELPEDWRERTTLYRLYHSLELWDWFKSIGTVDPLDSIAADLAEIVRS